MAPKKERDEALAGFTSKIFSSMLEEVLMDVVLQSHQEIARSRSMCSVCHTRCGSVHVPGPSNSVQGGSSTRPSPPDGTRAVDGGTSGTGANTPTNGNVYFECTNCHRQIASNRYAPHLSSCMGLGNSRRGAARSVNKSRLPSEVDRSASPHPGSDNGHFSEESKTPTKNKGKSKVNREDEAEFTMARKRTGSPSVSPIKKTKKQKIGSPIARVKTDPDLTSSPLLLPIAHTSSHTKIPSKLRESSVVSSVHYERRSSTPESSVSSPAHSASTPSVFSVQSPLLSSKAKPQNGKPTDTHLKRASPVRPPSPVNRIEHDFLVDVEGEETGSSTDSDSS